MPAAAKGQGLLIIGMGPGKSTLDRHLPNNRRPFQRSAGRNLYRFNRRRLFRATPYRPSRLRGNPERYWLMMVLSAGNRRIPAYAGMTVEGRRRVLADRSGFPLTRE